MKLTLHIGTEKTGTTTVQHWFSLNRESLRFQGVYYPKTLGIKTHRNLSIFAIGSEQAGCKLSPKEIIKDYEIYASNLIRQFECEYAENLEIKNWVISNEHLHSRLISIEMVEKVKEFLGNKFANIEVVVHLRPQVDVAVSLASTATRHGKKIGSSLFLNETSLNPFYNYNSLIERWENVFGADCVTIVAFKNQPCMTSFLINKLDLEQEKLTKIERQNESVDWRTMALINAISRGIVDKDKSINFNQAIFINDLPYQEKLSLGIEIAKEFQLKFEESNNQLINRREDLTVGDLTPDWSKYDIPANIHHLDSSPVFTEQLSYLVMRFNSEIKLEQCNTKLAECERALALNKLTNARKFLQKARAIIQKIPKNEAIDYRLRQNATRIEILAKKLEGTNIAL